MNKDKFQVFEELYFNPALAEYKSIIQAFEIANRRFEIHCGFPAYTSYISFSVVRKRHKQ